MNLKEIKEIIALMNENGLNEIEVEREGSKIKIKKGNGGESNGFGRAPAPAIEYRVESAPSIKVPEEATSAKETDKGLKKITSPMVGTFYRAPSPEAALFVEIGQVVEVGQVVCIIEAMKLMNEIKAEFRGKVSEISVDNAEPVEYGQTLFVLEPV